MASTEADLKNAVAMKNQAAVRLGYTNVYAPVSGTVSVRAARQGEVVNIGAPIVTIVDLNDTWARVAIPETYADHIGYGDVLRVRLPGGTVMSGKVFFKGVEGDFATQRDVSRRKRDIKTIVLKVRMDNPKGAFVPGHDGRSAGFAGTTEGWQSARRCDCGATMMAELNPKAHDATAPPANGFGLEKPVYDPISAVGDRSAAHRQKVRRLYRGRRRFLQRERGRNLRPARPQRGRKVDADPDDDHADPDYCRALRALPDTTSPKSRTQRDA